ncbi:MAG: uroporphyrinogen-III C-methyltransferase [Candidatus Marinimicrobia bacterium]|nr:uroporphyrinogen-III C-methyltransferase [Candidatus Neomarinimicrobiota bacterium]
MNTLFPIFLKIDGQPCLVVGGGQVAQTKIEGLLQCHARITVIAQEANQTIQALANAQKIDLLERPYEAGDVNGQVLVVAATDHQPTNRLVYQEARRVNIPVNVVDDPPLCSFYYPAVYQEGELKIAISTNGQAPVMAKLIRDDIKEYLGGKYGALIAQVARIRAGLFQSTSDSATRKGLIEGIVANLLARRQADADTLRSRPAPGEPHPHREPAPRGKVSLVGAGPGDPELITVKGLKALQLADVIIYDALIDPSLLLHAREDAELIFAGKRCGSHSRNQLEINQLILNKARANKSVVRLKGGDPFIFGRGGEEAESLARAGIAFEVISGITAGVAAPAYAGIPLTSRGYSSSVAFISGHQFNEAGFSQLHWEQLVNGMGTLVIYMGIRNLVRIARQLIACGRSSDTPVAIVQRGTLPDQNTFTGTLGDLLDEALPPTIRTPAIIIIGNVVNLRRKLRWFDKTTGERSENLGEPGRFENVVAAPARNLQQPFYAKSGTP